MEALEGAEAVVVAGGEEYDDDGDDLHDDDDGHGYRHGLGDDAEGLGTADLGLHGADDSLCEEHVDCEDYNGAGHPLSIYVVSETAKLQTYPPLKKIWATSMKPRACVKTHMIQKSHVMVRTMQKSNMRSESRNLWPRLAFARYIEMCVTAPPMNMSRKTMVSGKSTFGLFGANLGA